MWRFLTAGESHGRQFTVILEGVPAGLKITAQDIDRELSRRQQGYGRGERMLIERDRVEIVAGVRDGYTLGSPVALVIANRDWENWKALMATEQIPSQIKEREILTRPRPGHADLAGAIKFQHRDMRNVLERASARETVARVAAGAIARKLLQEFDIRIISQVVAIGPVRVEPQENPSEEFFRRVEESPLRCGEPEAEEKMMALIDTARGKGETLGGIFEVRAMNLPVGLGSYSQWDLRLDGLLAGALMSIPGIKGVEMGMGFAAAAEFGSQVHDIILYSPEKRRYYRPTNRAGGMEGGVTNGEPLIVRAAMKPIPTLGHPLPSVDIVTREVTRADYERADICAVPAAAVVGEAMVALVIAGAMREKFGGDSLEEMKRNYRAYQDYVNSF